MKREDAENAYERIRAASVEIGSVAKIFREKQDEDDAKQMLLGCGRVLAVMHDELLQRMFAIYPDLETRSRESALSALTEKPT